MIESDIICIMSGLIRNSGQNHLPSSQEYRLLASDPSQLSEDDLPSDLQSLSWLTSVDVPRLQQMASERMDFGMNSQSAVLQQPGSMPGNMLTTGAPGGMIHIQASLPQGILGLNTVSSHGTQMSRYAAGGQPSPSLQPQQPPLFPPPSCAAQQVFAITHNPQQCPPATIFSASYGTPSPFSQPRLAPHTAQELHVKPYPKPIYSYSCLIAMALKNSKTGRLPVSEIYTFMKEHFPYFKTAPDGWKNSVRHNLSLNKCFEKVENKMSGTSRKGCLWALNPAKIDKMEEEMQKWKRKDLAAIHRSMANPEELDKLITDRPENCRRPNKPAEAEVSALTHVAAAQGRIGQLQPQPVMTLSLQAVPLHHQIQTQACMTPDSPAPAQTPPLHALRNLHQSPRPQHLMSRASDFLSVATDMSTEVDALDPSIMDFAFQGNIWDEMKDESFNLETLGAFSNSPLALSDCDLIPAGLTPISSSSDRSFADLQVTGLYTTYTTLDTVSSAQYISTQGNKPIALL
ncbi:forkhead box protein N4 [Eublepharis macularius]|uniref:Forkhead box protein N4 n=1 Tax=Eublepharis macularius TaxID=481883 RepID=A0AA97LEX8_EUBMA|nr:forkhead box protein N4 [Eublepharis macularius]